MAERPRPQGLTGELDIFVNFSRRAPACRRKVAAISNSSVSLRKNGLIQRCLNNAHGQKQQAQLLNTPINASVQGIVAEITDEQHLQTLHYPKTATWSGLFGWLACLALFLSAVLFAIAREPDTSKQPKANQE